MFDHMTQRQKDLLLAQVMYRIKPEDRRHLMREIPDAYSAWCGTQVVKVVRVSDGVDIDDLGTEVVQLKVTTSEAQR